MNIRIDEERLTRELEELSAFSATEPPAITRIVFSEQDMAARRWLKQKAAAAGLHTREDAIGNTFFRWEGENAKLPPVATGSHIDALPSSGRFDGTVGVIGGLEAIRALQASGFAPRRTIELVLLTSEEPTRFGYGCLGSRMLAGAMTAEHAASLRDSYGASLDDVRRAAGFTGSLESVQLAAGHYAAFVELHIEQGPILEARNIAIGIVKSIAAPAALRVVVEGDGGHAGAVLMRDRRDALIGAAEMILAVEAAALATGSSDSVATTGICNVFPGAVNSVPSRVTLEIDIRDSDLARRDGMMQRIMNECKRIADRKVLNTTIDVLNSDAPATCDPLITQTIASACDDLKLTHLQMVSRAYHDTLFMSRLCPAAMIFVPCEKGYSHRPEEFAASSDVAAGVAVLAQTLAGLAS